MSRTLAQTWVVMRKELRDAFRDRRAIYSVLFGSLFGPVLVGVLMNGIADRQREVEDVQIPVVGLEHAPTLMEWLRQQAGVTVVAGPVDAEKAVRDRTEDVVVVIPKDYASSFRASKPVELRVVSDGSRNSSRPKVRRVLRLLERYSSEVAAMRMIARGVSPAVVTPLRVEEVDVSSAQPGNCCGFAVTAGHGVE